MTESTDTTPKKPKAPASGRVAMRVRVLESLRQVFGQFEVSGAGDTGIGLVTADPEWTIISCSEESLTIRGVFAFLAVDAPESSPPPSRGDVEKLAFLKVRAVYDVRYALEPGEQLTDEDLKAFAKLNGTLNVYPYWREYVSGVASRAELPAILLPPFNPLKPPVGTPLMAPPAGEIPVTVPAAKSKV